MLRFLDGPAAGVKLCCARAPIFLRVVDGGTWDALDQLADEPKPTEKIYVYRKVNDHGMVHYDGIDRITGRRFGRWEQFADYVFVDPQPDESALRTKASWAAWATSQAVEKATT